MLAFYGQISLFSCDKGSGSNVVPPSAHFAEDSDIFNPFKSATWTHIALLQPSPNTFRVKLMTTAQFNISIFFQANSARLVWYSEMPASFGLSWPDYFSIRSAVNHLPGPIGCCLLVINILSIVDSFSLLSATTSNANDHHYHWCHTCKNTYHDTCNVSWSFFVIIIIVITNSSKVLAILYCVLCGRGVGHGCSAAGREADGPTCWGGGARTAGKIYVVIAILPVPHCTSCLSDVQILVVAWSTTWGEESGRSFWCGKCESNSED